MEIKYTRWSANNVAHSLAGHAKHIDDVVWLEESPPPALEVLYLDSLSISEWMKFDFAFQKKNSKPLLLRLTIKFNKFNRNFAIYLKLF